MAEVKTYHSERSGIDVTAMIIEDFDDVRGLRAADWWHKGDVAMLTFPTHPPVCFVSNDNNKYMTGRAVGLHQAVVQGPAGDWGVVPVSGFLEEYSEVPA